MKGTAFEIELSIVMSSIEGVKIIPNLTVYSKRLGRDTEIDRLLIYPWGIFSVEAKSFNTALHGSLVDHSWVGVTGRKTTTIYNPIMQNYEHIRSLNNMFYKLTRQYLPLENIVVIPDGCRANTDSDKVYNLSSFRDMLVRRSLNKPKITEISTIAAAITKAGAM
jgi:hypothetical protein